FAQYALRHGLPNKWTFPTYFLFMTHPQEELFVKPQVARWLLKFLGHGPRYTTYPSGDVYRLLRDQAHALRDQLAQYGPRDMIDIQSFLWICARESRARTGRLDVRGQVDLDIPPDLPPAPYATTEHPAYVHDEATDDYDPNLQPSNLQPATHDRYPLPNLARDTGFAEDDLARWVQAIERKGQAIFYGPPGTGKTLLAQALARHLAGGGDGFVDLVQFHPAYQYEDFIQGLRPTRDEDGALTYEMVPGRFLQFCQAAQEREDRCVLIVDEINRANLSRVFGELMYLLEYRDRAIPLAGGGELRIPSNVRLLGTMNTADRSIALVDHALRRRFAFIALHPNYDLLRRYHAQHDTGFPVEKLIAVLQRLNRQIGDPHYAVGVTYFLRPDLAGHIADIWQMEIEPYLEEYFFDRPEQVDAFRWAQVGEAIGE
ncbi:MAG: McrB family protein, partial [Chloroflexota bacterium]